MLPWIPEGWRKMMVRKMREELMRSLYGAKGAENERRLSGAITIPDLKQVDPTKPATPFKDREEQIKFMSARDENGNSRYDRDPKYRDWVIERIAASSF